MLRILQNEIIIKCHNYILYILFDFIMITIDHNIEFIFMCNI